MRTRKGNSRKLTKSHVATTRDAKLFHHGVVNYWNKLPDSVVLASSASCCKKNACLCLLEMLALDSLVLNIVYVILLYNIFLD